MVQSQSFIPAIRYRQLADAVDFLCGAFGFTCVERDVEHGRLILARLTLSGYTVLLSPDWFVDTALVFDGLVHRRISRWSLLDAAPEPQPVFIVVDDVDAHWPMARDAGAEMLEFPHEVEDGGRCYSCRDLEGHIWTFGSYRPLAGLH